MWPRETPAGQVSKQMVGELNVALWVRSVQS